MAGVRESGAALVFFLVMVMMGCSDSTPPKVGVPGELDGAGLPDVAEPDATEPDATEPDATEPDATEPDATEPDVTEPDAAEPDAAEPDAAEPDAAEPDAAEPDAAEPDPIPDPEPSAGLDERPPNPSCLAPPRPAVGGVQVGLQQVFSGLDFTFPLAMEKAPGDGGAWHLMEKSGKIHRFEDRQGVEVAETVLDIEARVVVNINSANDERGLLGMAFHPDYVENGELYLSYTGLVQGQTWSRVSRFRRLGEGPEIDPDSEEVLFQFFQPANNHNGGDLKFGPDGLLYLSFGDGGGSGDTFGNGQDTSNLFATIARIDVDRGRGDEPPYGIPPDNPFAAGGGAPEIYAWGLRNVWRFSFDRETGELWAADVGQRRKEEVDLVELGGNYGWPIREGDECFNSNPLCDDDGELIDPVAVYARDQGISITGGYVYRGAAIAPLIGAYVYGDFATGRVFALFFDENGDPEPEVVLDASVFISAFAQDAEGELYILSYRDGRIFKVVPETAPPPPDFPGLLSETGCVEPQDPSRAVAGMIPYGVNMPFWSDGAEKRRHFAIPDGSVITVDNSGGFVFPVGSVTMKTFYIGERPVETRLFVRHDDGTWGGYSYAWDAEGADAVLLPAGAAAQIEGQRWDFPSRPQCVQCHTEAAGRTLGLETLQLNGPLTYPRTGRTANQLQTLVDVGVLEMDEAPELLGALPSADDENEGVDGRARAYLHVNCGSCHRPGGTGRSELDLTFAADDFAAAVCGVAPEFGDLGVDGAALVSGADPLASVLFLRPSRRDVKGMPPLASARVDEGGLELLEAWIEAGLCDP